MCSFFWMVSMCRELDALRQSIVAYGRQFDPRVLTPAQAGPVVRVCAQIEASVASIKSLAAARAAESCSKRRGSSPTRLVR